MIGYGSYTLQEAHNIAETVHDDIEQNFPKVKHIMLLNQKKGNVCCRYSCLLFKSPGVLCRNLSRE